MGRQSSAPRIPMRSTHLPVRSTTPFSRGIEGIIRSAIEPSQAACFPESLERLRLLFGREDHHSHTEMVVREIPMPIRCLRDENVMHLRIHLVGLGPINQPRALSLQNSKQAPGTSQDSSPQCAASHLSDLIFSMFSRNFALLSRFKAPPPERAPEKIQSDKHQAHLLHPGSGNAASWSPSDI